MSILLIDCSGHLTKDSIMNILITGFPTLGGSGLVATRLGIQLSNLGHEVHFMFYKRPFLMKDRTIENIYFHQVERPSYALFSDIGAPYTIQSASKMVEIVNKFNIDIIHSHYAIPHAVASYLAKLNTPVKTVVTLHGSDTHTLGHDASYQSIVSQALQNTDALTAVSSYLAKESEIVFDLPEDNINVIYNFINPNEFSPDKKSHTKNIVQASNFRPIKQVPYLIEIFSEITNEFPEWRLQLIGYGPEYPICQRLVRELKISDKVDFLGVRKDVPKLLAQASILASTSKIESFGLTIAESMSCETPIFAPNVGGIPEVCKHNENGLLFDPGNKTDACDKLILLMEDDKLRADLGKKGRKRIINEFSPEIIVKKYEDLYFKLLN